MNVRKKFSLKNRLYLLLLICVIPLTVMITYLLFMINNVSSKYDHIVEKITKANAYNIGFKEDIDYVMYIIVVNSERAEELVDTQKPQKMRERCLGNWQRMPIPHMRNSVSREF